MINPTTTTTKMDYSELLKDPRWQRKRLEIFQRDNWTCKKCSDIHTQLQVHHFYYIEGRMPWEYPNNALITVCELCHKKLEFYKYLRRFAFTYLRNKDGFEIADVKEIIAFVKAKIENNHHRESVISYIKCIKNLIENL